MTRHNPESAYISTLQSSHRSFKHHIPRSRIDFFFFKCPLIDCKYATMFRSTFIGAAVLALLATVSACSCIEPPPLSECAVGDDEAALLVRVISRQTFQCNEFDGTVIADVLIRQVFKDNTELNLTRGSVISVETNLFGNLCGFDLEPATQYILFVNTPFVPEEVDEPVVVKPADDEVVKPARRLRQTRTASVRVTAQAVEGASVSARGFSDGETCDIPSGDVLTSLCSGNVVDPKRKDVEELTAGCAALM